MRAATAENAGRPWYQQRIQPKDALPIPEVGNPDSLSMSHEFIPQFKVGEMDGFLSERTLYTRENSEHLRRVNEISRPR